MQDTTTHDNATANVTALVAALRLHERAKLARPEDNPFHEHSLDDMGSAGLRRSADRYPALNMAPTGALGHALEEARFEVQAKVKADTGARRKHQRMLRAERQRGLDAIDARQAQPDADRLSQAWLIVLHLAPIVDAIVRDKRQWATRLLGTTMDDVPQEAKERIALLLAKSDKDLDVLTTAAAQLGEQHAAAKGAIPGTQRTDVEDGDDQDQRRKVAKGRKWLMGVVNNRVMAALTDAYTTERNLRFENIDLITTVMANLNGPGTDPLTQRFRADRAPAFLGTRFQAPGGIDQGLLATAINAAITERKLDRMVELLLAGTNTDGAFPWTEQAEDVFLASPEHGEWLWRAVVEATTGRNRDGKEWEVDRARKARGDAARTYVRNLFAWLPGFIVSVVDAFDHHAIGHTYKGGGMRAVMVSDFELFYLPDPPKVRLPLRPILRFADAAEAAHALLEHMADVVTHEEVMAHLVGGA